MTLVDTGEQTQTGGRLRSVMPYVGDEDFCFTYGDGVSSIDIGELIEFHRREGVLATVTAVQPPGRFGALQVEGERVRGFREKPHGDGGWINGGFFVLSPKVADYIDDDATTGNTSRWNGSPPRVSSRHTGTTGSGTRWTRCATSNYLEELWSRGARRGRSGTESRFWRGRRVLITGQHRVQGKLARVVAATRSVPRARATRWHPPPTRHCSSSRAYRSRPLPRTGDVRDLDALSMRFAITRPRS